MEITMRELKNREIIAGLLILILLAITALILIIKKEIGNGKVAPNDANVSVQEAETENMEAIGETGNSVDNFKNTDQITQDKNPSKKNKTSENISTVQNVSDKYVTATLKEYKTDDWQLKELFFYWDEYQLDAVEDLIRLERVRAITNELSGTNNFYYFGDTNDNGNPNGKGLAVYANNTYYCGEWKNGKRSGEGMWLRIYPDKTATVDGNSGVTEHLYNGMFSNDYPNGTGQEHIEYDLTKLNKDDAVTNAIGNFKDGYYDGEMYIMTISTQNSTTDWYGDAKKGSFIPIEDKKNTTGKEPVWKKGDGAADTGDADDEYYWMLPRINNNLGISGLKK